MSGDGPPTFRLASPGLVGWYVIIHADGSRVSIAIICLSVCDSVCLRFCPYDKAKTAETKIAKLGTQIVHHDTSPTNEYYVKGQG